MVDTLGLPLSVYITPANVQDRVGARLLLAGLAPLVPRLDESRRNWLNPEGADEALLKKRTLTNLYNDRPTWLTNTHTRLDRAVFAAYGWEEEPGELSDEEILRRLLALNLERSESV